MTRARDPPQLVPNMT